MKKGRKMKKKTLIIFIVILLLGVCVYKKMSSTNIKHYNSNVVILDAGHGGSDTGATESGINEKDINLNAVKMIGNYLEEFGIEVIYTRNDVFLLYHFHKKYPIESVKSFTILGKI